jgi:hypothetical protein
VIALQPRANVGVERLSQGLPAMITDVAMLSRLAVLVRKAGRPKSRRAVESRRPEE